MLLPKIKLKTLPTFPSVINGGVGIDVAKQNGALTVDLDYSDFGVISSIPISPTSYILTYDTVTQSYVMVPSHLLGGGVSGIADAPIDGRLYGRQSGNWVPMLIGTQQIITTGASVTVAATDGLIAINKTTGSPTTVVLPASSSKTNPVLVVDWKGDASTNPITVTVTGSDKFNAGLTSWVIHSTGASYMFTPLSNGAGYAV